MKPTGLLNFGIIVLIGMTLIVSSSVEGTSPVVSQSLESENNSEGSAPKIDPREGRVWAPWTYASGVQRGRWNVGYGGSRNAPNVAWDSTMG